MDQLPQSEGVNTQSGPGSGAAWYRVARLLGGVLIVLCLVILVILTPHNYRIAAGDWQVTTSYRAVDHLLSFPILSAISWSCAILLCGYFWRLRWSYSGASRMRGWRCSPLPPWLLMPITFLFLGNTRRSFLPDCLETDLWIYTGYYHDIGGRMYGVVRLSLPGW